MIQHDPKEKKFFAETEGEEARLLYRETENKEMDLYSTFVPPAGRGQGLAKKLVEAAIEYAESRDFKIIPSCSYVKTYFDKHQERQKLLA